MSDTIVDMPKFCQMLDNGWKVRVWKNEMGTYSAEGETENEMDWRATVDLLKSNMIRIGGWSKKDADEICDAEYDEIGKILTDDFLPEQALTRLAYKIHGEII